jgi:2,4-dienoyl-CoA reductase (NADPH2)
MLLSPTTIGKSLRLHNRIVMAPLYLAMDGRSDEFRAFYVRRAQGRVGLVIAPQSTPGGLDDWAEDSLDLGVAFRPLIEGCHAAGSKIALQMFPGGGDVDAFSTEELDAIPARYARAALGARDAGFDAIDVHGAHHSPLMRLLSPLQNHRTDRYGGSAENRRRVQVETVRAIRAAVGPEYPILYRFSASSFRPGGVDLKITVPFAQALEAASVDCLDVSAGGLHPEASAHPGRRAPLGCFAELAGGIRAAVGVPVIAVGKIATREVAESILEAGQADLVALGRSLIADPDWPHKLYEGRDDEIVPCLYENAGCVQDSISVGKPVRCIQNPEAGLERLPAD